MESRKVREARTVAAVTHVAMRVVAEDDLGVTWEPDPDDVYLGDRTPAEVTFAIELRRRRARR